MIVNPQHITQTLMFTSLDDLISPEHPVRIIEALIEKILKENQGQYKVRGNATTGRPAYSEGTLLKIFIYGYINRITSSRRLEQETYRNIELMWLIGNLRPDHKTISDFRKDNKSVIKQFSRDLKLFLKGNGLASLQLVSIDGTKLKANASREMLSESELIERISGLEEEMEHYIKQMDNQDDQENEARATILKMQEDYEQRISTMQSEIGVLRSALEKLQIDNKNYVSLTDMDCSKQKSRDGIIPGYNVQLACDTKYGFIVAEEVTNESNDINQFKPMLIEIQRELESLPSTVIADTGYCNYDQIQEIEAMGCNCYVPPQREQNKNAEITFTYQEDKDRYICSEGKYLTLERKNKKYKNSQINVYVGESCQTCHLYNQCTESKSGRHISRYWNQDYRNKHREKMGTRLAKNMSIIRKTTIEPINGTLKVLLGKIPLLTRGKENVKTEIKILTTSFNIKKLIKLFTYRELMGMI